MKIAILLHLVKFFTQKIKFGSYRMNLIWTVSKPDDFTVDMKTYIQDYENYEGLLLTLFICITSV